MWRDLPEECHAKQTDGGVVVGPFRGAGRGSDRGNWTGQVPQRFPAARSEHAMRQGDKWSYSEETRTRDSESATTKRVFGISRLVETIAANKPADAVRPRRAYDSSRGKTVLFGGILESTASAALREWLAIASMVLAHGVRAENPSINALCEAAHGCLVLET